MARNRARPAARSQVLAAPAPGSAAVILRLALSLLADLGSSAWHFLAFLVRPAPMRERMSRLILTSRAAPPARAPAAGPAPFAAAPLAGETEPEAVGAGSAVRSLLLLTGVLLLVGAGCTSEKKIYRDPTPHPGTSFSRQMEELAWSTETLLRMDDWQESMKSDLQVLFDLERGQFRETLELWGW